MKLKRPRIGIKWNIFFTFVIFSAVMLSLLWFFQIVFLDDFYRSIKTASIESTADTIARNIDNAELSTLIERLAQSNDVSIVVMTANGTRIAGAQAQQASIIQNIPPNELMRYYQKAADATDGHYLETINLKAFRNDRYDSGRFIGRVPPIDEGMVDAMIYAQKVTMKDGTEVVVLLNTQLTPVNSTVETLRTQLVYITILLVALSLILALFLSRRVAKPIIRINNRSKELAHGNYEVQFDATGYKEIAELADTLNYTARELNQVETLRRELIANVSHDLRTPLTMISGYAEVMRDLPGENNPENVQVIIDEARRLNGLVNDILDLSKLQSGSQKLNLTVYDLTGSIRAIIGRCGKLIDQEGYDLRLEADQDVLVKADERRIEQVLYNLINNAINYTGADKKVLVRQTLNDGSVRIEVIDSGEGIAADQLPYIWDRYYKVDKTHRRAVVGTGLGLSIVKGALDLHHAQYGVQSKPGEGSVFWFQLPLAEEQPEAE